MSECTDEKYIDAIGISNHTINIHFREVMKIAEGILGQAARVMDLGENSLTQIMCEIKASWIGSGADIITGKEVKAIEQLIAEAQNLQDIADDLAKQANKMYKAERLNNRTAGIRFY